jgi:hypothetical protein
VDDRDVVEDDWEENEDGLTRKWYGKTTKNVLIDDEKSAIKVGTRY